MFNQENRNWTEYRKLPKLCEVDFHPHDRYDDFRHLTYDEKIYWWHEKTCNALQSAYEGGFQWVLFLHGHSTSRPGKTTARSVVRGIMRSKDATPFIVRRECIQHPSVFLAAIRERP